MNNIHYDTDLNIYVQIDSVKSVSEYDSDHWVFEGIASTEDLDLYDEVVYPESFLNSIEFFKSNGKIFFDHEYAKENSDWLSSHGFSKEEILALKTPIGKPLDAKITKDGLYIKAVLNKEHPMARLMWNQYLNNSDDSFKDQIGLSIGAKYLGQPRKEFDAQKGKYVTFLPDLLLYEVSMTPEPVNPYTKTWSSIMKSMVKEAIVEDIENKIESHVLPENSVKIESVDEQGNLTIKSLVEGEDGVIYELLSTVNLKEGIIKAMDEKEKQILENVVSTIDASEEDVNLKAVDDEQEEDQPEESMEATSEDIQEAEQGVSEAADEVQEAGTEEAEESAEAEPETPMMEEGSEEGESGEESESAASLMDALVDQSDEAEEGQEEGQDDAQEMVLDKLDAVLDSLSAVAEMLSQMTQEAPAGDQVTEEVPTLKAVVKEVVEEALKSVNIEKEIEEKEISNMVELSSESAQLLADSIKSVFSEIENSVVEKVTEKVIEETSVVKSVESRENSPVVHPGTRIEGKSGEETETQVLKSVAHNGDSREFSEEKTIALKSLVSNYIGIRGYTADKSQQRARVIERAEKELDISPSIFNVYVRKAEKGSF